MNSAWNWFCSYIMISGCTGRVTFNGKSSNSKHLNFGVPQVSPYGQNRITLRRHMDIATGRLLDGN